MSTIHHPPRQLGRARLAGAVIAVALIGVGTAGLNGSPQSSGDRSPAGIVQSVIEGRWLP